MSGAHRREDLCAYFENQVDDSDELYETILATRFGQPDDVENDGNAQEARELLTKSRLVPNAV